MHCTALKNTIKVYRNARTRASSENSPNSGAAIQNQSLCSAPEKGEKSEVLQVCLKIKIHKTVVLYYFFHQPNSM